MNFEYKVVPIPSSVKVEKVSKSSVTVAKVLEDLINEQAKEGWEYLRIETLYAEEPGGCGSGRQFVTVTQFHAVYRRSLAS